MICEETTYSSSVIVTNFVEFATFFEGSLVLLTSENNLHLYSPL